MHLLIYDTYRVANKMEKIHISIYQLHTLCSRFEFRGSVKSMVKYAATYFAFFLMSTQRILRSKSFLTIYTLKCFCTTTINAVGGYHLLLLLWNKVGIGFTNLLMACYIVPRHEHNCYDIFEPFSSKQETNFNLNQLNCSCISINESYQLQMNQSNLMDLLSLKLMCFN